MWLWLLMSCAPWSASDLDGDGFAAPLDCQDGDPKIHPGARDPIDDDGVDSNCDGMDGVDADSDGMASVGSGGVDCEDDDPDVHPLAIEVCNGIDDDCNGFVDDDAVDRKTWYRDGDGDGFGGGLGRTQCLPPPGPDWTEVGGDCRDKDETRHPGAVEPCGVIDMDCDQHAPQCAPLQGELETDVRVVGPSDGSGTGRRIAAVGDVDGDGWEDLVVGAPELGQAWIVGAPFVGSSTVEDSARVTLLGAGYDRAGSSVAAVGDVDRDGVQDVLIGAEHDDLGDTEAGAAWLLFGGSGSGGTLSSQALHVVGLGAGDHAGAAVAGPGDVNGDRVPDLLIGAPERGAGGSAFLVAGGFTQNQSLRSAEVELVGPAGARAGAALAGLDMDGDGLGELVIGGPAADAVWVVLGGSWSASTTLDLASAHARLAGAPGDGFGSVLVVSDVDRDGYGDVWVAAPDEAGGVGAVHLFDSSVATGADPSGAASASIHGLVAGDRAGASMSRVPDVDGDRRDDLVLSSAGTADAGAVWLFTGTPSGATDLDDAAAWVVGTRAGAQLGAGVAGGDWNRDDVGDLAVGAPGLEAGEIGLFYGD